MGCIYFIRAAGTSMVKIGYTAGNPLQRLRGLQTGSPIPLEPIGFMEGDKGDESDLHARFSGSRRNGEWFDDSDGLAAFIADSLADGSITPEFHGESDNAELVSLRLTQANRRRLGEIGRTAIPGTTMSRSATVRFLIDSVFEGTAKLRTPK